MLDDQIRAWMDSRVDEMTAFVQDLIRTPAPADGAAPDPTHAAEVVTAKAAELGLAVNVREMDRARLKARPDYRPGRDENPVKYVLAQVAGGGGPGRSLVVNGHIDVVTAGALNAWTHPPFGGDLLDGVIYGRGASDALGPFTVGLFGAACAAEVTGGLGGDLSVVAATDEEVGGMSTLASLVDGITADAAVVCEPTEMGLAPAGRGITAFRITVEGRHAHAGAAFRGVNAVVKGAAIITALNQLEADLDKRWVHEIYKSVPVAHCFNIAMVRGADVMIAVPDRCVIQGLAPIIGTETVADIQRAVEERVADVATADPWLREHPPVVEWMQPTLDPAYTDPAEPIVQTALAASERMLGTPATIGPLLGASDLRHYSRGFGIPSLHFGPGGMHLGHGPDEHIDSGDLSRAGAVLAALIADWCGSNGPTWESRA
jgi:acetylornithine deacetylase